MNCATLNMVYYQILFTASIVHRMSVLNNSKMAYNSLLAYKNNATY